MALQRGILLSRLLRRREKDAFIKSLSPNSSVLDVGCGSNSPFRFKIQRPDIYYIGLDVADHNQTINPLDYADRYIITAPDNFAPEIVKLNGQLDAVVSSFNIGFCNQPDEVLDVMLNAVKPGGKIYLSFPCEESVNFPNRRGTLNFSDEKDHKFLPNWKKILAKITSEGFLIDFAAKRYRPWLLFLLGLILEPLSAARKRIIPAGVTWALYGFESIIWASRPKRCEKYRAQK